MLYFVWRFLSGHLHLSLSNIPGEGPCTSMAKPSSGFSLRLFYSTYITDEKIFGTSDQFARDTSVHVGSLFIIYVYFYILSSNLNGIDHDNNDHPLLNTIVLCWLRRKGLEYNLYLRELFSIEVGAKRDATYITNMIQQLEQTMCLWYPSAALLYYRCVSDLQLRYLLCYLYMDDTCVSVHWIASWVEYQLRTGGSRISDS